MSPSSEIKTPFLRYFLLFYGNFTYHLIPSNLPLKNVFAKCCHFVRLLYHFFLFLLFNWICAQPNAFRDDYLAQASNGKPLLTQSFSIISLFYSLTFATAQLYSFLNGSKIVQHLDQLQEVQFEPNLLSKSQAKWLAGSLIAFDNISNYLIHLYAYQTISSGSPQHLLWLLVQYIDHCQAMVFFRLLAYGKWATLRCLEKEFTSDNDDDDDTFLVEVSKRSLLLKLVEFNHKLNHLTSVPLLTQVVLYQLITVWVLCFYRLMTPLELLFLPFPLANLLVVGFFTRKIRQKLIQISSKVGSKADSQRIYWNQVEAIYGPDFECNIFSLITVDANFTLRFTLIIVNLVVLINQTT